MQGMGGGLYGLVLNSINASSVTFSKNIAINNLLGADLAGDSGGGAIGLVFENYFYLTMGKFQENMAKDGGGGAINAVQHNTVSIRNAIFF